MPNPASRTAWLLFPALLALAAAPAVAGIDRWTQLGPSGMRITDVVVDPRSPTTLWVAGDRVYKSEDGGATFHPSASGLEGRVIKHLAIDPGQPDVLYGATYDIGDALDIYRSQDGGAHWTQVAGGEDFSSIWSLAVAPGAPGAPGVVFVGTDVRLFRSVDGGASFETVISLTSADLFVAVTPDFRNPGTVYSATLFGRAKSTDFGATWTDLVEDPDHFPPFIHDLVVAPGDSQTLYETGDSAEGGATWRSRDGGATWQGPFPFAGDVLAVDPADSNTVYGGSLRGLFVSHDGGETFTEATRGLPPLNINVTGYYGVTAIRTDPTRPRQALAATGKGLFATASRGRIWRAAPMGGLSGNPIANFRIDPYDPAHWILNSFGSFLETHDGGLTFMPFADALQRRETVYDLVFDPFVRNRLWALGFDVHNGLFVSTDGGATWFRRGDAPMNSVHLLLPAPRVLLLAGSGIFRSGDAGGTWRQVQGSAGGSGLLRDPRNPRTLYDSSGNYRSDDVGRTWRPWHPGSDQTVGFDPFHPRTVHLVQGDTLFVTRDDGVSFQVVGHLPLTGYPSVLELLFDRERRNVLYAATAADGILRSRDGGVTWEPLNDGLPLPAMFRSVPILVQDPARGQRFYAFPEAGGFFSADFTGG